MRSDLEELRILNDLSSRALELESQIESAKVLLEDLLPDDASENGPNETEYLLQSPAMKARLLRALERSDQRFESSV